MQNCWTHSIKVQRIGNSILFVFGHLHFLYLFFLKMPEDACVHRVVGYVLQMDLVQVCLCSSYSILENPNRLLSLKLFPRNTFPDLQVRLLSCRLCIYSDDHTTVQHTYLCTGQLYPTLPFKLLSAELKVQIIPR